MYRLAAQLRRLLVVTCVLQAQQPHAPAALHTPPSAVAQSSVCQLATTARPALLRFVARAGSAQRASSMEEPYRSNVFDIAVMGAGGVGKTCLTVRLLTDCFVEEYDPTIGSDPPKQLEIDGKLAILNITDTAGQEEFAELRKLWMEDAGGFLFVYSVTSPVGLELVAELYEEVLRVKECAAVPAVIVGNKCDLEEERKVTFEEGKALAERYSLPFMETSAKTKINHEECFRQVVREMRDDVLPPEKLNKRSCVIA
eukprot:PLAT11993.1.p1 GENE.PLAT11993.1~~PLAT11993.1.p1  ORF type:complete len:256 (-),score=70.24 PLAT11993.1:171-938(-)